MKTQFVMLEYTSATEAKFTLLMESNSPILTARVKAGVHDVMSRLVENLPSIVTKKTGAGRKGKPVQIIATDAANPIAGVKGGAIIESAVELSSLLGYKFNAVVQALSAAKKIESEQATLRGVTFQYVDITPDQV